MLDLITPMIVTFNEEANIGRTLDKLSWAKSIVVVDSGSTDRTLEIVETYPQAKVFYRSFDTAAQQCNFGLTKVASEWTLSLDADYVLSDALIREITDLRPDENQSGFEGRFSYCIHGRPLSGSLYPARVVLYRRSCATYVDEGHTQRVRVDGTIARLQNLICHDDRKPLKRWFVSQARYAALEAEHLLRADRATLGLADRIRLLVFPAPLLAFFYTLFFKRCIFDGIAGCFYATQRLCAEVMLSIELLDRKLN